MSLGRAAIAIAAVRDRSREVVGGLAMSNRQQNHLANGRDGNHVPTHYNRGNLEPAAEDRTADTRKADAPVAVTRHPKE